MTIKARESLTLFLFITACAGFLAFVAGVWALGSPSLGRAAAELFPEGDSLRFAMSMAAAAACGAGGAALLGILAFRAGKSVSVEIFFYSVWAFCLGLELVRGAVPWLVVTGAGIDRFGLETRFLLFGRYLGILSLFFGSLYAAGFQQERVEFTLGAAVLVATVFATIHPLNQSVVERGLYVRLGYGNLIKAFVMLVIVATGVNYLIAWREHRDRAFLAAGAGALASAAGAITLGGSPTPWALGAAALALGLGSWLHLKSLYQHYLWR